MFVYVSGIPRSLPEKTNILFINITICNFLVKNMVWKDQHAYSGYNASVTKLHGVLIPDGLGHLADVPN